MKGVMWAAQGSQSQEPTFFAVTCYQQAEPRTALMVPSVQRERIGLSLLPLFRCRHRSRLSNSLEASDSCRDLGEGV